MTPPMTGLIHTGSQFCANARSNSEELRITRMPIMLTISASPISSRYCSRPTLPTLDTSSE